MTTPSVTSIRRRLRRPPPPWRFRLAQVYVRLVNGAVAGAVGWGIAAEGLRKTGQPGVSESAAVWLSVAAVVVLLEVLSAFGPVFLGPDRMFWVASTPVDRRRLLLPRFLGLAALGAAAGAVWPAVASGVVGSPSPAGPLVFAGAAVAGIAVTSAAVVAQGLRLPRRSALVAVAVVLWPGQAWWLAPVLFVVAAVSLRRLRRTDLAAGASLAAAVRTSVAWLDLGLLGALLAQRRARLIGRVRSARLRGSRLRVLVWTDLLRVRRAPASVVVWVALLPLPALVAVGGEVEWVAAVHLLCAFVATDRLASGLRTVCRSAPIRRSLGVPDGFLRLAHLVVPAAAAVVWCLATVPFTPHVSWLNGVVSAVGAVAVVYRVATRPPLDYGVAAIDFGVLGPVPLGLVVQLSRGPVLLYLLCVLQVVLR